jgi:hypothetical protein
MRNLNLSHLKFWENTALSALLMEVGGLGLYAWAMQSITAFAILFLLALAATGGGGVLGFLFGIPRFRADAKIDSDYLPNTNLEQVSDWLTKIIIGATLVQLDDIARAIGRLSSSIGAEIGQAGGATAASTAMIFSFVGGFMWAYLWTSVRLSKELERRGGDRVHKDLKLAPAGGQPG